MEASRDLLVSSVLTECGAMEQEAYSFGVVVPA